MRIFKFGGASIKDADSVRNIYNLLQVTGHSDVLLVVSAMGKTTNAIEEIINNYFEKSAGLNASIQQVKNYHNQILLDLFENDQYSVFGALAKLFDEMELFLQNNKSPNYNYVYDQLIGYGELLSTTILTYFFSHKQIDTNFLDVRHYIKTNSSFRDAEVDWEMTQQNISKIKVKATLNITQGFLGSDDNNFTTSLGREGSDYTAAIFGYCLNADSVTVWKDVPGVMNADPRFFENTVLLDYISYREAIELAFYGATVIHPKTLQPLQRKEIPLYVKSFLNPTLPGTKVGKGNDLQPLVPCFIVKRNQLLISLSSLNFSFIMEENISEIFALLHKYKLKVHLIQNSAISFSVCCDDTYNNFENLKTILSSKFSVSYNRNVSLYTIRHFDDIAAKSITENKQVLLTQTSRETVQIVAVT